MRYIQPTLVVLVTAFMAAYFARYRSKLRDRIVILAFAGLGLFFIASPGTANVLARRFGVGRGVDLLLYLTAPGLAFLVLLMFARMRQLQEQLTLLVREIALSDAKKLNAGGSDARV